MTESSLATFSGLVDLASARFGGRAISASDDFFAPKENILNPGRGDFIPGKYTGRGKWMDGWESRRNRHSGKDWCVVKLGIPGLIRGVDIDTNHFRGNHPPFASLDACERCPEDSEAWDQVIPVSTLRPSSQNLFAVQSTRRWAYVRLNIIPDGGVARLRVYGQPVPDWNSYATDTVLDLAAIEHGGKALVCSDMFFSDMQNLLVPGAPVNMGDGWETRRKRGSGNDWVVIQLGVSGHISRIEVDTTHFKGNYPDRCSIQAANLPEASLPDLLYDKIKWRDLMPETPLAPDFRNVFEDDIHPAGICTHVRLNIFPDGGIARLRVFGVREKIDG